MMLCKMRDFASSNILRAPLPLFRLLRSLLLLFYPFSSFFPRCRNSRRGSYRRLSPPPPPPPPLLPSSQMKGSSQHRRLFLLLRLRYRIVGSEAASYINKGGGGGSIAFGYMEDIISTGGKGKKKTVSEGEGQGGGGIFRESHLTVSQL